MPEVLVKIPEVRVKLPLQAIFALPPVNVPAVTVIPVEPTVIGYAPCKIVIFAAPKLRPVIVLIVVSTVTLNDPAPEFGSKKAVSPAPGRLAPAIGPPEFVDQCVVVSVQFPAPAIQ